MTRNCNLPVFFLLCFRAYGVIEYYFHDLQPNFFLQPFSLVIIFSAQFVVKKNSSSRIHHINLFLCLAKNIRNMRQHLLTMGWNVQKLELSDTCISGLSLILEAL